MAGKELIVEFAEYDVNHVVANLAEIRRYNLQRYEMEQLSAMSEESAKIGIERVDRAAIDPPG